MRNRNKSHSWQVQGSIRMCRVVRLVCKAQNTVLKAVIALKSENSKFGRKKRGKRKENREP